MALFYEMIGEHLLPAVSTEAVFPFITPSDRAKPEMVSLVGGGGKTTTLYYLGQRAAQNGLKVLLMTTTKMARPESDLWCKDRKEVEERWQRHLPALIAEAFSEEKIQQPDPALFQELYPLCDLILVEADGSKHLPVKVPRPQEPVILPETDIVIALAGAGALGKPLDEVCFHPELVRSFLERELGDQADQEILSPRDLARILISDQGGAKGVGKCDFYVLMNQADEKTGRTWIEETGRLIQRDSSGSVRILASYYEKEERS